MEPNTTNVIPFPVKVREPAQVRFDASGLPIRWIDRVLRSKRSRVNPLAKVVAIRLDLNQAMEPDLDGVTPQWLMQKLGASKSAMYRALKQLKEARFIDDDLNPIETQEDRLGFEEYLRQHGEPPREQWLQECHARVREMAA